DPDTDPSPASHPAPAEPPASASSPSQIPKVAIPAATENQPNLQSSSRYFDRKNHSAAMTAMNRSGYSHSNVPDAARAIIPAAKRLRNGVRYAAVGLGPVASAVGWKDDFRNHITR